jgi:hypothetical protein
MALVLSDAVSLSPEAKEILRKLRKQMSGKTGDLAKSLREDKNFKVLLGNLQDMQEVVYGDKRKELEKQGTEFHAPIQIPLGSGEKERRSPRRGVVGDDRLDGILEKMIVFAPSDLAKGVLKKELEPLGENIIAAVKAFGVRMIILPRNQALTDLRIAGMSVVARGERTFDGRPWEQVRGIYCQDRRLIVVGEERIGNPFHSVGRHEFAHAFDHTFTTKNQRRLPLSVQLWNLFRQDREGLVSSYASTNPAEYFAESVETFFKPGGKDELQKVDPKMFQYLENLFAA